MKWPGKAFHLANATEWMCNVCGKVANTGRGAMLRRSVRDAHNVSVCAFGLRASLPGREKMARNVARSFILSYYEMSINELRNTSSSGSRSQIDAPVEIVSTSRSEAAPFRKRNPTEMDDMVDEYVDQIVARNFNDFIYFGTVVERIRGPVMAVGADGKKVLQAVWKIVYDDADTEQLTRVEIIDSMRTYRLHESEDKNKRNVLGSQVLIPLDDEADDVNEADFEDGLVSTDSKFLNPRYNLLDVLPPIASQNRLSYLIELVIDECQKGVSNEAVKIRSWKDAA